MLLASEARRIADVGWNNLIKKMISDIENEIKERSKNGNTYYSYYGFMPPEIREELERCGYKVKNCKGNLYPYIKIEW